MIADRVETQIQDLSEMMEAINGFTFASKNEI